MAIQTTPHTQTEQNVSAAAMDLEPGMNMQDLGRGKDAALYENNEGAQTGGTRAFNANAQRDRLPNALDERTGLTGNDPEHLPREGQAGITSHPEQERERQEKVLGGR